MRVLVVSHYALPHLEGIEILADQLASELLRRGHDVTHVASAAGRRTETGTAEAPQREHRVVRVPALNFPESRFGVPYPIFGPSLVGTLRREVSRADVVHAHGCLYPGSLTALALAARNDVLTVLTKHVGHVPYDNRLFDAVEASALSTLGRWSLRRADSVIVFNANVRELVAHLAPLAMVRWIDNGIDTDLFRPPEPGERARLRVELGWDAQAAGAFCRSSRSQERLFDGARRASRGWVCIPTCRRGTRGRGARTGTGVPGLDPPGADRDRLPGGRPCLRPPAARDSPSRCKRRSPAGCRWWPPTTPDIGRRSEKQVKL